MKLSEAIKHCKERIDCSECGKEHKQLAEWLGKLKHYEDLEAQGRLIEMPCYVGDTMYADYSMQGWYIHRKNRPYEAKVVFIGINGVDNFMNVELGEGKMLQFRFSDIGKKVFLTKSEAETALKESEQE